MQFTPQQMAGAQRYGSQTRIGNWYEDERLAESRYASFTDKKDRKLLASDNRHKKMDTCMQKVPLSYCEGEEVRYGSVIQLQSAEVGGPLACDPFEEIYLGSQTFLATVAPRPPQSPSPARMAFKVVAVTDPRLKDLSTQVLLRKEGKTSLPAVEGEPVRYGDLFHLVGDPGLRVCDAVNMRRPPLYLASALKTQSLSSRVSNRQAVFLRSGASSGTVWQFQKTTQGKNGSVDRLSGVGLPVKSNIEVVIQHRDTLMALSCERSKVEATDFGAEFEVCCESLTTNGRSLQLLAELEGRKTAGSAAKSELRANRWLVRQGQHEHGTQYEHEGEYETPETVKNENGDGREGCARQLPPEMTPDNLLQKAKCVVRGRLGGVQQLRSALRSIDPVGDGKLDREDFRWCLQDFGLTLDEEQSKILFDKYDRDASGLVEIEEFLSGLREPLSERKKSVIEEAFCAMGPDKHGKVTLKQLQATFDAEAAGRALSGNDNAAPTMEALDALRSGLGATGASKNGAMTLPDLERYHEDLCVDGADDGLFEGLVRASWSGGGGGDNNTP